MGCGNKFSLVFSCRQRQKRPRPLPITRHFFERVLGNFLALPHLLVPRPPRIHPGGEKLTGFVTFLTCITQGNVRVSTEVEFVLFTVELRNFTRHNFEPAVVTSRYTNAPQTSW